MPYPTDYKPASRLTCAQASYLTARSIQRSEATKRLRHIRGMVDGPLVRRHLVSGAPLAAVPLSPGALLRALRERKKAPRYTRRRKGDPLRLTFPKGHPLHGFVEDPSPAFGGFAAAPLRVRRDIGPLQLCVTASDASDTGPFDISWRGKVCTVEGYGDLGVADAFPRSDATYLLRNQDESSRLNGPVYFRPTEGLQAVYERARRAGAARGPARYAAEAFARRLGFAAWDKVRGESCSVQYEVAATVKLRKTGAEVGHAVVTGTDYRDALEALDALGGEILSEAWGAATDTARAFRARTLQRILRGKEVPPPRG